MLRLMQQEATIRGRRLFEGGDYSRAAFDRLNTVYIILEAYSQVSYYLLLPTEVVIPYVGLQHAVSPTNAKFKPLLLPTQAGIPFTESWKNIIFQVYINFILTQI